MITVFDFIKCGLNYFAVTFTGSALIIVDECLLFMVYKTLRLCVIQLCQLKTMFQTSVRMCTCIYLVASKVMSNVNWF